MREAITAWFGHVRVMAEFQPMSVLIRFVFGENEVFVKAERFNNGGCEVFRGKRSIAFPGRGRCFVCFVRNDIF